MSFFEELFSGPKAPDVPVIAGPTQAEITAQNKLAAENQRASLYRSLATQSGLGASQLSGASIDANKAKTGLKV